jgi:hypothetical protein
VAIEPRVRVFGVSMKSTDFTGLASPAGYFDAEVHSDTSNDLSALYTEMSRHSNQIIPRKRVLSS